MFARRVWFALVLVLVPRVTLASPRTLLKASPHSRLTRMCGTGPNSSGPAMPDVLTRDATPNYAVSVTPKGGTANVVGNNSGYQVTFTVSNIGLCPDTYGLNAFFNGQITSVSVYPTSTTGGQVTVTYGVGTSGSGQVILQAVGLAQDTGYYNVTVTAPTPAVSVTPKGDSTKVVPYTSGNTVTFTVKNTGNDSDTYTFTDSYGAPVTGVSLNPTSAALTKGNATTVTATYSVGAPGTGKVTLTATGSGDADSASYKVNVVYNGPAFSLAPHDSDYHDVTKCVASCFDETTSYSTPPYYSWDTPHAVTLNYVSATAHPYAVVQVNAWDTTANYPAEMSIRVQNSQGQNVTFTNNSTEIFYVCNGLPPSNCDSTWNLLAAQFDASALSTGDSSYTLAIRSYYSGGGFRESDIPIRVLLLNQSASLVGAGWSIGGWQQLSAQGDGVVITEGNGSAAYFKTSSCGSGNCTYTSPPGDFTTVTSSSSGPPYQRVYPDSTAVVFLSDGRINYVRDRHGNRTTYGYNASNQLVAITDPAGQADSLGYSGSGKLSWIKDPGGRVDSITVDGSGNLTQIKDWAGGVPFQGVYDSNHHLVQSTDRRGGAWGIAYDFAWKLAADTAPQVAVNGQSQRPVVSFGSRERSILANPSTGQGSETNPVSWVNSTQQNVSVVDARGNQTSYHLDRFGAPTVVNRPLGPSTTYTRDPNSHILRTSSPSGHVILNTWSGPSLVQVWDSTTGGRTVNISYERTYNKITLVAGDVDSVYNFWVGGLLDSTRVAGSSTPTRYTYTSTGRLATATDPAGHTVTYYYHPSGFQNTDSVAYTIGRVAYQYDGHGQRVATIDPVNDTTRTRYDSIGRVIATIGPLHDSTTQTYDGIYLTQVRDAKGQTYQFWPDALGASDSSADAAGAKTRFQYDANGNRTTWTNRRGQTVQFTYDSLDQMRLRVVGSDTAKFLADPAGHYTAASNAQSTDTLWVDRAGRDSVRITCRVLVSGNAAQCFRDSSTYEVRGMRVSLTLSAGSLWGPHTATYHYNTYTLLDSLTNFTGETETFTHTAQLLLDSTRTFVALGGLTQTYSYPWTTRPAAITFNDTALTRQVGLSYAYDAAARVMQPFHGNVATPDTIRSVAFDRAGEVTQYGDTAYTWSSAGCTLGTSGESCNYGNASSKSFVGASSYVYDSLRNRKDSTTQTYAVALGNRLTRFSKFRMTYDADGDLTVKQVLNSAQTKVVQTDSLFWSALGYLDSLHLADSTGTQVNRSAFGYDGWGRRVRLVGAAGSSFSTSRFLWDGSNIVAKLDTLGYLKNYWTFYPNSGEPQSVGFTSSSGVDTTLYYVTDALHNVVATLKSNSGSYVLHNQYRYGPFGDSLAVTGTFSTVGNLRYKGAFYDPLDGFYLMGARYYDTDVGRFISEDPLGLTAGLNQYAFPGNDAVNGWDPEGTDPPNWLLVGMTIANFLTTGLQRIADWFSAPQPTVTTTTVVQQPLVSNNQVQPDNPTQNVVNGNDLTSNPGIESAAADAQLGADAYLNSPAVLNAAAAAGLSIDQVIVAPSPGMSFQIISTETGAVIGQVPVLDFIIGGSGQLEIFDIE